MSDEQTDDGVELYPPWKEALKAFDAAGYSYGDLLTREWFVRAIGMEPLAPTTRLTETEHNRYELALLQQFTPFRNAILETYQMDLVSDQRGAYIIINPAQQAQRGYKDMTSGVKREMRRGMSRIKNVNVGRLTATERQAYMDVLANAGALALRLDQTRRLPMDE